MAEETERKQGKPWTNEAVFKTYEEAFVLVQEINEMSAISEKKVRAKIKKRTNDTFVVKVRTVETEPTKHKKLKAKKK